MNEKKEENRQQQILQWICIIKYRPDNKIPTNSKEVCSRTVTYRPLQARKSEENSLSFPYCSVVCTEAAIFFVEKMISQVYYKLL